MKWVGTILITLLVLACSSEDEACSLDGDCEYARVCDRDSGECVKPPGDCVGDCSKRSVCDFEDHDTCIKNQCGAAFLGFYRDSYGADCEQAWLDLMECKSNLSCDEYVRYNNEVDPNTGTSPFCQPELQAKVSEC